MESTEEHLDPLMGEGMYGQRILISGEDLVWLRALIEAQDGLGFVYSRGDGVVYVVTTADQQRDLDSLLRSEAEAGTLTCVPSTASLQRSPSTR